MDQECFKRGPFKTSQYQHAPRLVWTTPTPRQLKVSRGTPPTRNEDGFPPTCSMVVVSVFSYLALIVTQGLNQVISAPWETTPSRNRVGVCKCLKFALVLPRNMVGLTAGTPKASWGFQHPGNQLHSHLPSPLHQPLCRTLRCTRRGIPLALGGK